MSIFCNVPMNASQRNAAGQYQGWAPGHVLTYGISQAPPGLSMPDFRDVVKANFATWQRHCGLRAEYRSNPRTANIHIYTRRIDGPEGILAQAELPQYRQAAGQLGRWFDTQERKWVIKANPGPGEMDILRVDLHEGGHNLGLGHAPQDGSPADLMDPRVSHIREPQADWDIPQIRFRYPGQPTPDPVDPTKPKLGGCLGLLAELLEAYEPSEEDIALGRDILAAWKGESDA